MLTIYNKIYNSRVNIQLTNHSSATERELAEEQRWFLSGKLLARLEKSWATCEVRQATLSPNTKLSDKVAQLCCVSDIGLTLHDYNVEILAEEAEYNLFSQ